MTTKMSLNIDGNLYTAQSLLYVYALWSCFLIGSTCCFIEQLANKDGVEVDAVF